MVAGKYGLSLQSLMPSGLAWAKSKVSKMSNLMLGIADEFDAIESRAFRLIRECDPHTTSEAITDWERITGLPDVCTGPLTILSERRAAVLVRLAAQGGQSRQFMIDLAASVGYVITITEPSAFNWTVTAPLTTIKNIFVAGSLAGEPLREGGNTVLECVLTRAKPAHTVLTFVYIP